MKNDQGIADSTSFLALADVQLGDLNAAGRRLEECLAIWGRLNDLQGVAWASAQLGLVRLAQSDAERAWQALMTSLTLSASLDFRGDIYLVFDGLARLALILDQPDLAACLAAAAASVREQSGITLAPVEQSRADRLLNDLHDKPGDDAVREAWTHRHEWMLESIIQSVTVAPGLLLPASDTPSVTPTDSPA